MGQLRVSADRLAAGRIGHDGRRARAGAGLDATAADNPGGVAVIADDDEFFRMALAAVLARHGMGRVIQTGSYDEAMAAIAAEPAVDIALFDLNMPGMTGPAALHRLREGCGQVAKVAVVSGSRRREDILETLQAGAHGYISKAAGVQELSQALEMILGGRIYVPLSLADVADAAAAAPAAAPTPGPAQAQTVQSQAVLAQAPLAEAMPALSPRQSRVLEMLVHGKSNKEIARELNLGAGTVKVHMAALFAKLGVANRAAAAVAGTRILGH